MKDIKGYEGLYAITSCGKVWSYRKQIFLKLNRDSGGYLLAHLFKNGEHKAFLVHRLVAKAFLENPNDLPCINHKDCNPLNNSVLNLEWCDHKYNNNYGTHKNRQREVQNKKKVLCIEKGTTYESISEAARQLSLCAGDISKCCRGKRKTCGGFHWKFVD